MKDLERYELVYLCHTRFYEIMVSGKKFTKTAGVERIYNVILNETFKKGKRYAYIPQSVFGMAPNTLKRNRDELTEFGIIEWKATERMTMYKILEPASVISYFDFDNE